MSQEDIEKTLLILQDKVATYKNMLVQQRAFDASQYIEKYKQEVANATQNVSLRIWESRERAEILKLLFQRAQDIFKELSDSQSAVIRFSNLDNQISYKMEAPEDEQRRKFMKNLAALSIILAMNDIVRTSIVICDDISSLLDEHGMQNFSKYLHKYSADGNKQVVCLMTDKRNVDIFALANEATLIYYSENNDSIVTKVKTT